MIGTDDGIMVPGSDSTWNVAYKRRKDTCDLLALLVLFFLPAILPKIGRKKDRLARVPESIIADWLLVIGIVLLEIGYWYLVIDYWLLLINNWLLMLVVCCWRLVIGIW